MTRTEQIFMERFKNNYGRQPNIKELRLFLITGGWVTTPDVFIDIIFGIANNTINAFDLYYVHDNTDPLSATRKEEKDYISEKVHVFQCIEGRV